MHVAGLADPRARSLEVERSFDGLAPAVRPAHEPAAAAPGVRRKCARRRRKMSELSSAAAGARRALIALLLSAGVAWFNAGIAHGATTDIYPDFAFASAPGWQYQNYFDWANVGNTNSLAETPQLAYYTRTGITGTGKDSFEFWVSGSVGYENTDHAPDSSSWGVASPNVGVEWYYNLIQSNATFGSDAYQALTISPFLELLGPNGNTKATGFGAGADQWSVNSTLLVSYRKGRFTTTVAPFALTYAGTNLNSSLVTNAAGVTSAVRARPGWSGAFGLVNVGYDVAPTLTLALQQVWNVYSFADARDSQRASEGTIGLLVGYSGLSDSYGIYIAAGVQVDYFHSPTLRQATYITTYITKHF